MGTNFTVLCCPHMQAIYKINRRAPSSLVAYKSNFTSVTILKSIDGANITDLDLMSTLPQFFDKKTR